MNDLYYDIVLECIDNENYDFSEELDVNKIAKRVSYAYGRLKQGANVVDFSIDGYKFRIHNENNTDEPSSYVSCSNNYETAISEDCYAFYNRDEDDEFFDYYNIGNILGAMNEAYYVLVS